MHSDPRSTYSNGYQVFPNGRESENIQRNASPYGMNMPQFEPQPGTAPGMNIHGQYPYFHQDHISEKMANMKLDRTNSYPGRFIGKTREGMQYPLLECAQPYPERC